MVGKTVQDGWCCVPEPSEKSHHHRNACPVKKAEPGGMLVAGAEEAWVMGEAGAGGWARGEGAEVRGRGYKWYGGVRDLGRKAMWRPHNKNSIPLTFGPHCLTHTCGRTCAAPVDTRAGYRTQELRPLEPHRTHCWGTQARA